MDRADVDYHGTWNFARIVDAVTHPHRPALHADLTAMIDARGGDVVQSRSEIASATAALLVRTGREGKPDERFVDLAEQIGLDTLAALWSHADPVSLPGALWALYLLRQWCRTSGDEVTRLWRAGEAFAAPDAVVAGVGDFASVEAVQQMTDAVLTGAYGRDFDVALERAAGFFRVVAAGRRELAAEDDGGEAERLLAERNDRAAADLSAAAALWRRGALT
jgi:hypothetical protein